MPNWKSIIGGISAGIFIFLALAAWALASPVGAVPDEDYHLASIWCGQGEREGLCEVGTSEDTKAIPDNLDDAACYIFNPNQSAGCMGTAVTDSDFDLVNSSRLNAEGVYPPGFYFTFSFVASSNVAVSTLTIRLINAGIFALLTVVTWMLLPGRLRPALAWSAAAGLVPLGVFVIPSVNPSSWAIGSIIILFPAVMGFINSKTRGQRIALGIISVIAAAMSFSARGDSAIYSAVAVFAAVVLSFRWNRKYLLLLILPGVLILAALITFLSAGQTSQAIGGMGDEAVGVSSSTLLIHNFFNLPGLFAGALGMGWGLGWLDTMMPPVVWASTLFVFSGVLFVSLRWTGWRKAVSLAGVGGSLFVIPMYILYSSGVFVGSQVQPRYLLPLMLLLLAVALAPNIGKNNTWSLGIKLPLTGMIVAGVALSVANSVALFLNIRRYVAPSRFLLDSHIEWWWSVGPSPLTVWFLGSVFFALVIAVIIYTTWRVQRDGDLIELFQAREPGSVAASGSEDLVVAVSAPIKTTEVVADTDAEAKTTTSRG